MREEVHTKPKCSYYPIHTFIDELLSNALRNRFYFQSPLEDHEGFLSIEKYSTEEGEGGENDEGIEIQKECSLFHEKVFEWIEAFGNSSE